MADPTHAGRAVGYVEADVFGGRVEVQQGWFNLFVATGRGSDRRMLYRLWLTPEGGADFTLVGYKDVHDDPGFDLWEDTTTLFVQLLDGHVPPGDAAAGSGLLPAGDARVRGAGILRIAPLDFARQLTTFAADGPKGIAAVVEFGELFLGDLWGTYAKLAVGRVTGPEVVPAPGVPRYVRPGTAGQVTDLVPVTAGDGLPLNLLHVTREDGVAPTRGPVLLVHGAGVRAESFRPPLRITLVHALLNDGFDVWLANWRASIDLRPVAWTLDEAAAYDFPPLVARVLAETGAESVKAFVHCQGSTAFTIAAVSGLLPQVSTIVTNAVTLHPVLPRWSQVKIVGMLPAIRKVSPTLSPRWGYITEGPFSRALRTAVVATHWECDNPVCAMVSFVYGSGHPALWSHANLDEPTHDWLRGEFAGSPMTFFSQMRASVLAGHLVPTGTVQGIAPDLLAKPQTDARWVLLAGEDNRCFLPESQQRSFEHLDRFDPGRHSLHRIRGYGHLDIMIGARAHRDVYPLVLDELRK